MVVKQTLFLLRIKLYHFPLHGASNCNDHHCCCFFPLRPRRTGIHPCVHQTNHRPASQPGCHNKTKQWQGGDGASEACPIIYISSCLCYTAIILVTIPMLLIIIAATIRVGRPWRCLYITKGQSHPDLTSGQQNNNEEASKRRR